MKIKFLTIYAAMISASVLAQDTTTNTPATNAAPAPAIETPAPAPAVTTLDAAPATPAAAVAPEATLEPAKTNAPEAKKTEPAKKKVVKKKPAPELKTTPLVPGPAVVAATRVNVRGIAGLKGEIITRLTNGEPVTVIEEIRLKKSAPDEPAVWAKIGLPAKVNVWVKTEYIDKTAMTVKAKKLNLRGGAGENFSVLGVLKRGDLVKEIEVKGDWTKIEAPAGAFAFMAAQYLTQETIAIASAGGPTGPGITMIPDSTQTTMVVEPTTEPTTTTIDVAAATTSTDVATPTPVDTAAAVTDPNAPPPPRIVAHEGLVRGATSIQAPTSYELVNPQTRKIVNYLRTTSTNLDLSRYKGLQIVVTGEEGLDERWKNTPVIVIQRIQVIE